METATCYHCGAAICWVRTDLGSLMPINADPDPSGNIVLLANCAHVLKGDLFEGMVEGLRYASHLATCPHLEKFRKPKKEKK